MLFEQLREGRYRYIELIIAIVFAEVLKLFHRCDAFSVLEVRKVWLWILIKGVRKGPKGILLFVEEEPSFLEQECS